MKSISLGQVRIYNFAKHHVIPGLQANSILEASKSLVGLHAARLPTPFVMLKTRVNGFQVQNLLHELYTAKSMIKLRCMRKTMHIVPLEVATIVHQSTKKLRLAECLYFFKMADIREVFIISLMSEIVERVKESPASSNQILKDLIQTTKLSHDLSRINVSKERIVRFAIKYLWEEGVLCYINESKYWGSERRLYGYTTHIYPSLNLQSLSVKEAQVALVQNYIEKYGPVTEGDICWWSGLSKGVVRNCIAILKDNVRVVSVQNLDNRFYMTALEYEKIMSVEMNSDNWITLLAYEDSSLKGYFESRERYIKPQYNKLLFNRIGEARASIMVNGEVIGIWKWDKMLRKVSWQTFDVVDNILLVSLQEAIHELECCLNSSEEIP